MNIIKQDLPNNTLKSITTLLFSAIVLFWGAELYSLSITMDEELHAFGQTPNIGWLEQGRWGTYFLNKFVMPYNAIPITPLIVFLFLSTAAYLVIASDLIPDELEKKIIIACGFLIFIGHPVVYYIASFNTINYAIGVGFLLSSLGVFLLKELTFKNILFSIITFSFAISIYQGFLLVVCCMLLFSVLMNYEKFKDSWYRHIFIVLFILLTSLIVYYIIDLILINIFDIKQKYLNLYISKDSILIALRNPLDAVLKSVEFIFGFYSGTDKLFGNKAFWVPNFSILLIGLILFALIKSFKKNKKQAVVQLFLVLCILLSPFLLVFIAAGNQMPTRSLIAFPLSIVCVFIWALWNANKIVKRCALIICCLYIIELSGFVNRTHQANEFARQYDKTLLSSVVPLVYQKAREEGLTPPIKLLFNGSVYNRGYTGFSRLEVNGQSYFEFGGGNQYRIHAYMKMLGYEHFEPVDRQLQKEILSKATEMRKWPLKESIQVVNEVIIVQL